MTEKCFHCGQATHDAIATNFYGVVYGWDAYQHEFTMCDVCLDKNYPKKVVDLDDAYLMLDGYEFPEWTENGTIYHAVVTWPKNTKADHQYWMDHGYFDFQQLNKKPFRYRDLDRSKK